MRKRYEVRRLPAALLPLLLLGVPSGSASAEPTDVAEVERLYVAGQDRYAEKDYAGAVEAWTQLLELLPEEEANRATRENVVLAIADAHVAAYHHLIGDDGQKDVTHLQRALDLIDAYELALREAYGPSTVLSDAVKQKRADVVASMPSPEVFGPCLSPPPCLSPCLNVVEPPRGCRDHDPAAAFVVLGALGLRIRRRRDALDEHESTLPADVVAKLRARLDDDET